MTRCGYVIPTSANTTSSGESATHITVMDVWLDMLQLSMIIEGVAVNWWPGCLWKEGGNRMEPGATHRELNG
jgi:hypothetical protein